MEEKPTALILGGSHRSLPLIRAAEQLGFRTLVAGKKDYQTGHRRADVSYKLDLADVEALAKIVEQESVTALIPGCGEVPLRSATILGKKYSIGSFDSLDVMELIHNKWQFKNFCLRHGITVPAGTLINRHVEAKYVDSASVLPYIVKPLDLSAGRGVTLACNVHEFIEALRSAGEQTSNNKVLVEEYIEGEQLAYSAIIQHQAVGHDFVARDLFYQNKYLVATAHTRRLEKRPLELMRGYVNKIASELNLVDGPFHAQFILKEGQPYIIDVSRRIPGDLFPYLIELSTGIQYSRAVVLAYLGRPIPAFLLKETKQAWIIRHCPMPAQNGTFQEVIIDSAVKSNVIYELYTRNSGARINDYLMKSMGVIFLEFPTEEEMLSIARKINSLVYPVMRL